MNVFNRVLIVLFAVLLLVASGAVLLGAVGVISLSSIGERVVGLTELDRGRAFAAGVPLFILGLLLLYWELRPRSFGSRRLTLKEDGLGRVTVARDGVNELVEHEAAQVSGIVGARSRIVNGEAGLRIDCRVSVDPTESLPERTEELRERLTRAIDRCLGKTVEQVNVEAQVAHSNGRRSGARVR